MAVTIEEMEVEVHAPATPATPSVLADKPPQKVSLKAALEMIHEREQRLKAD